jgi:hypothetical protein
MRKEVLALLRERENQPDCYQTFHFPHYLLHAPSAQILIIQTASQEKYLNTIREHSCKRVA